MFSVVIPVFNHERFLLACVHSAVTSPLVNEVLLLDDGSSDGSYPLIRALASGALPKVRDVTPSPRINRSAHVALNHLIDLAQSEWIAVLNSDDAFVANRFELLERRMKIDPADLWFGSILVMDESGRMIGRKRGPFDPQVPFPEGLDVAALTAAGRWTELLSHQNFVATTSNMVFRKDLWQRVGGFAPFRYVHDWDFALRASLRGRVRYLPHPLTTYRVHDANTIRESSNRVDAEVRALFAALDRDFPELQHNESFRTGLAVNPYLAAVARPLLSILVPPGEVHGFYASAIREALTSMEILDGGAPSGHYLYQPASVLEALPPAHLQNVALALAFQDLPSLTVTRSLDAPLSTARLLPGPQTQTVITRYEHAPARTAPINHILAFHPEEQKPVIFILPALFAVGGVERLIIDMMKELRSLYHFVVITVERLSPGHGSLHGAAQGWTAGFYDLAELGPADLFLPMMAELRDTYRPALVWIPNGSPWQCDHAAGIREVFSDIPIVDQQAYDTEAGWIARYDDPGIQSYDRFVAINTKIAEVLTRKYGIAADRVDMIYHSVNLNAIGPYERADEELREYRLRYALPENGEIFGWVGRLTPQKRPLEFLAFAREKDSHFVMVGNGELAAACDDYIHEHRIHNVTSIRFSDRMGELFAVMSGLLITSSYEGLPISMLEALSMGVPVLATDVGDVGVILSQYGSGVTVPADWDHARYLSAFRTWSSNLGRWAAAARAAAPFIRERFTGSAVARQYDSCWRRAISDMAISVNSHQITPVL